MPYLLIGILPFSSLPSRLSQRHFAQSSSDIKKKDVCYEQYELKTPNLVSLIRKVKDVACMYSDTEIL